MEFKDVKEIVVYKKDSDELMVSIYEDSEGIKQIASNDIGVSIKMKNSSVDESIK